MKFLVSAACQRGVARRDVASRSAVAGVKTALTMGDEAAKAETLSAGVQEVHPDDSLLANDTVPRRAVETVKLLLDVHSDVLLDRVLVECLDGRLDSVLLHVVGHCGEGVSVCAPQLVPAVLLCSGRPPRPSPLTVDALDDRLDLGRVGNGW